MAPSRLLLKNEKVAINYSPKNVQKKREIFLFNDMLLIAKNEGEKYRVDKILEFSAEIPRVCAKDGLAIDWLLISSSPMSIIFSNESKRDFWLDLISSTLSDLEKESASEYEASPKGKRPTSITILSGSNIHNIIGEIQTSHSIQVSGDFQIGASPIFNKLAENSGDLADTPKEPQILEKFRDKSSDNSWVTSYENTYAEGQHLSNEPQILVRKPQNIGKFINVQKKKPGVFSAGKQGAATLETRGDKEFVVDVGSPVSPAKSKKVLNKQTNDIISSKNSIAIAVKEEPQLARTTTLKPFKPVKIMTKASVEIELELDEETDKKSERPKTLVTLRKRQSLVATVLVLLLGIIAIIIVLRRNISD